MSESEPRHQNSSFFANRSSYSQIQSEPIHIVFGVQGVESFDRPCQKARLEERT